MLKLLSNRYKDGKTRPDFRTGTFGLKLLDSNFWGDGSDGSLNVTADTSLASTQDGDIVVKQLSSLNIDAGKTLTLTTRCKGLALYIAGDCVINGKLSMSARGANVNPTSTGVNATGIRIIRNKTGSTDTLSASDVAGCGAALIGAEAKQGGISGNGKIYVIPRTGASGGSAVTSTNTGLAGNTGGVGSSLQSGGGGSGSVGPYGGGVTATSGAGGAGTCFSGGAGGGAYCGYNYPTGPGGSGSSIGGPGGAGATPTGGNYGASGGAGNPGGAGVGTYGGTGGTGTGGLLMLFVKGNLTIGSGGSIESKGSNGGTGSTYEHGGGGSGGGLMLILYAGTLSNSGSISCAGGSGGATTYWTGNGGAGGAGSYVLEQIAI